MKRIFFSILLLLTAATAAAVELNREGRDASYVETILKRSQKIVDGLGLTDAKQAEEVRNIIANRYFELNDIYEARDRRLAAVKEQGLEGEAKRAATELATLEADSKLYRSHFAFPATLAIYLTPEQVEAVKDGMTYGVLMVTYRSTLDMIPSLTDEEKAQIKAWLTEARDLAIDAESSNKKHGVFGKYKGRINNYLTKRGYDLKAERAAWYKRIEARKQAEAAAANMLIIAPAYLSVPNLPPVGRAVISDIAIVDLLALDSVVVRSAVAGMPVLDFAADNLCFDCSLGCYSPLP